MAHNCTGDLKKTLRWQWGKCCFSLWKKTTTATKTQWTVDVCVVVGGDGFAYVVMEHMPKPQPKLRRTLHFSVGVVVGSVFFPRFSFP